MRAGSSVLAAAAAAEYPASCLLALRALALSLCGTDVAGRGEHDHSRAGHHLADDGAARHRDGRGLIMPPLQLPPLLRQRAAGAEGVQQTVAAGIRAVARVDRVLLADGAAGENE